MAAKKELTDKPSYHAVDKEDIVGVDRKMLRSNPWDHFGWHKKAICACTTGAVHAWVSRKGNNTSNIWHHLKSVNGVAEDSKM